MRIGGRRTRIVLVAAVGLIGGAIAGIADGGGRSGSLVLLAAGVVLGEMLVLRLGEGTGIPLSYAVLLVLVRSFSPMTAIGVFAAAQVAALLIAAGPRSLRRRLYGALIRGVAAVAAVGGYGIADSLISDEESLATLLIALTCAAAAVVTVHEVLRAVLRLPTTLGARKRTAWLAITSSGMLMAVGYGGVHGGTNVGIWGPLLFSIPLLAAWYAFDRLESASRTHRQTIEALSLAPELGGLVRDGHARRVAATALLVGRELDVPAEQLEQMETAALLHHLGEVILDDPAHLGAPHAEEKVAEVTAGILRNIAPLSAAGDIVAGVQHTHHRAGRGQVPAHHVASQVLKAASDFDDLTGGEAVRYGSAIEELYSAPGYVYDSRILDALERVLLKGSPANT
ncbi:MAG: hypothetical protein M5T61_02835 [Acidimicrobiia bacterium]|nr:hypothetical protein [Acidimicrobiia bacterium]